MCEPISLGVATAATGALGAYSSYKSGQAQSSAANAQAKRQYRNQLKVREADWDRKVGLYQYRKGIFEQQVDENNQALALAYQAEQQRLDDLYDTAAFSNQSDLIASMQAIGQTRARGVSGQSAQRAATSTLSQLGRNNATRAAELVSARNAYNTRTDSLRRRARSANNRAFQQVAIPPVAGIAPEAPLKTQGPSGLSLASGLTNSALSGFSAYQGAKAPSGFVDPPTGGDTGGFPSLKIGDFRSDFNPMSIPYYDAGSGMDWTTGLTNWK